MAVTFRMMQNTIDREKQNMSTIQQLMGQMNDILVKKTSAKTWAYEGYVQTVGQFFGRPGSHKLLSQVEGGKVICYIRVDDEVLAGKLKDFFHRRVGLSGQTLSESYEGIPVVLLEEIDEKVK
jgi:ethanolamine utilization protein EutP (predicted NTPase)